MKKVLFSLLAAVVLCACGKPEPKQMMGFIADASMNTVVVKALTSDSTYVFSTMDADKTDANGLLIGSPVIVEYTGELQEVTPATKVSADATYSKAVGRWLMPDPNAPGVDSMKMGINLEVEGVASSVNMATLVYQSWELQGPENALILHCQSLGNGQTIDCTENAVISEKDGKLYLSIEGTDVVYEKAE